MKTRYPRTLAEAFGPYSSNGIFELPRPWYRRLGDWFIRVLS